MCMYYVYSASISTSYRKHNHKLWAMGYKSSIVGLRSDLCGAQISIMTDLNLQTSHSARNESDREVCTLHMDDLYYSKGADAVYEYVGSSIDDINDPEVLWRYGRTCGVMYKCLVEDRYYKSEVIKKGLKALERAMEIHHSHTSEQKSHCIHWLGCLSGYDLELNPLQAGGIKKCLSCRDNFILATEVNPGNWEAWHSLGAWYYNVLDRPFYERALFSYLSGIKVTIEEGLPYLIKANEVSTRPYYMNWLYLGKCYVSLKRMDEAKHWLQKVAESENTGSTLDNYAKKDAIKILKEQYGTCV